MPCSVAGSAEAAEIEARLDVLAFPSAKTGAMGLMLVEAHPASVAPLRQTSPDCLKRPAIRSTRTDWT
jgi:hypothetical protein